MPWLHWSTNQNTDCKNLQKWLQDEEKLESTVLTNVCLKITSFSDLRLSLERVYSVLFMITRSVSLFKITWFKFWSISGYKWFYSSVISWENDQGIKISKKIKIHTISLFSNPSRQKVDFKIRSISFQSIYQIIPFLAVPERPLVHGSSVETSVRGKTLLA